MGIPSFFRWLWSRYPKIIVNVVEDNTGDCTQPNPNGVEYDNLYLDMNGIIHPCAHPEGQPHPENDDQIFIAIFNYIDRIFSMVRPRRLLYMAIDGVAPRAKMNQQRSRRFRAIRDAVGRKERNDEQEEEIWDSNQITPGTPFMAKVAQALRYYATQRISTDPAWHDLTVIISDASVPGEGEHKLMEFIRYQHEQEGYNANTRHCLYGLDADLIMLSLVSHEPHFTLIREIFSEKTERANRAANGIPEPFQFLMVNVLRDYLEEEFKSVRTPFELDLERLIDDFVLICFFVGNDFIPHLPTLEIHDNAIGKMLWFYKKILPGLGGYISENGNINFTRLGALLKEVADLEEDILRRKYQDHGPSEYNKDTNNNDNDRRNSRGRGRGRSRSRSSRPEDFGYGWLFGASDKMEAEEKAKKVEKAMDFVRKTIENKNNKNLLEDGETEWRMSYYKAKFGDSIYDVEFFTEIRKHYLEGLQWILYYYYQGCKSWQWFYPYHYAPFAMEIVDTSNIKVQFPKGTLPFKPFEQLLSVLPSASSQFLPKPYADLMINPESPIIDFYPEDYKIDQNGKKQDWKAVCLLPFIDEVRLFNAKEGLDKFFTEEETERNTIGHSLVLVHKDSSMAPNIFEAIDSKERVIIDNKSTQLFGCVSQLSDSISFFLPSSISGLPDLEHEVVCGLYYLPSLPKVTDSDSYEFKSTLKPGLVMPVPSKNLSHGRRGEEHEQRRSGPIRSRSHPNMAHPYSRPKASDKSNAPSTGNKTKSKTSGTPITPPMITSMGKNTSSVPASKSNNTIPSPASLTSPSSLPMGKNTSSARASKFNNTSPSPASLTSPIGSTSITKRSSGFSGSTRTRKPKTSQFSFANVDLSPIALTAATVTPKAPAATTVTPKAPTATTVTPKAPTAATTATVTPIATTATATATATVTTGGEVVRKTKPRLPKRRSRVLIDKKRKRLHST